MLDNFFSLNGEPKRISTQDDLLELLAISHGLQMLHTWRTNCQHLTCR